MKYMLDTNICIHVIKNKPETAIRNFLAHQPEDICISAITLAELLHGVEKSRFPDRNRLAVSMFLSTITVLDFDNDAARMYGELRADLERNGTPIGPIDMLIAGHARAKDLVLVTNNTGEFERVRALQLEDWSK